MKEIITGIIGTIILFTPLIIAIVQSKKIKSLEIENAVLKEKLNFYQKDKP